MQQRIVVAIDGPSGSGKSSVARAVARSFGLGYLDTGAMYRAYTLWSIQGHEDMSTCPLVMESTADKTRVLLSGVDVSEEIRGPEVTNMVSHVAADPAVRAHAVSKQRDIIAAAERGIVVEGRDITSVVAPDADVRVFLTADQHAREARRAAEFADPKIATAMRATISARDALDESREHSPLRLVDGVSVIDTTNLTLDEVVDVVRQLVLERMNR